MKYECLLCGYIYDNDTEDTPFEELPEDWTCPMCGAPKTSFKKVED